MLVGELERDGTGGGAEPSGAWLLASTGGLDAPWPSAGVSAWLRAGAWLGGARSARSGVGAPKLAAGALPRAALDSRAFLCLSVSLRPAWLAGAWLATSYVPCASQCNPNDPGTQCKRPLP